MKKLMMLSLLAVVGCSESFAAGPGSTGGAGGTGGNGGEIADGGTGGFGGLGGTTADGGGGIGGTGLGKPVCKAPPCASGSNAINCDPACGAMSESCAYVCRDTPWTLPVLQYGETQVRLPPLAAVLPVCATDCPDGVWGAWAFRLPSEPGCVSVDAPAGIQIAVQFHSTGVDAPNSCEAVGLFECAEFDMMPFQDAEPWLHLTFAGAPRPTADNGGLVRVHVGETVCPEAMCSGSCNGSPL